MKPDSLPEQLKESQVNKLHIEGLYGTGYGDGKVKVTRYKAYGPRSL